LAFSSHCDVNSAALRSTADRSLPKGTNPSTSLRKDRASRFPSIATAESGSNGEDWQMKVLEHEVGRADKNLVQRTFDFSGLKALK